MNRHHHKAGTASKRGTLVSHEVLRSFLAYEPSTGVFTWLVNRRAGAKAGDIAGCPAVNRRGANRWRILLLGKRYAAHRLAFFYVHERWPAEEIDHINGDPLDNRICNLREVSRHENAMNLRKARSDSTSQLIGAMRTRGGSGRWRSAIRVAGNRIELGEFDTAEEAHAAYVAAKRQLHSTCTI